MFKDFMILFYTCMYKAQVQGQIILVGGVKYILKKKKKKKKKIFFNFASTEI